MTEKWFEAHGFPYIKTENGTYFWQTNATTGHLTPKGRIIWHNRNFFNKIKKLLDK